MKSLPVRALFLGLCLVLPRTAQGDEPGFGVYPPQQEFPCLTEQERAELRARIAESIRALAASGRYVIDQQAVSPTLGWPLRAADDLADFGYHGISNFVDQDPSFPNQILDYDCGERTYDLGSGYNHGGTDFFIWPFSWYKMDNDQVEIVAAAPGSIVFKDDGNFDRNCGFGGGNWNAVYVGHADGSVAWYGHMKNGSVTAKDIGESVAEGEYLGIVGSSGNSTGPHLHFEVYDATSTLVDPYQGPCNSLNPDSWWAEQRPYYDSAINALRTHSAPPVFPACPNTEIINASEHFTPGSIAYFAAYYRDQLQGQVSQYSVRRPDGSVQWTWNHSIPVGHYAGSYWYWSRTFPGNAMDGVWTFEVIYEGIVYTHDFFVGSAASAEALSAPRDEIRLQEARPNPFGSRVELEYLLPLAGRARLSVYDGDGRRLVTLVDRIQPAGTHFVSWEGTNELGRRLAPGVYFARLESDHRSLVRKLVLSY